MTLPHNSKGLAALTTIFFFLLNIIIVLTLNCNDYGCFSKYVDRFAEMFNHEAAKNALKFGLFYNAGLPVTSTSWLLENFKSPVILLTQDEYRVYIHYPALSTWLTSLGAFIFGQDNIALLRIIPMLINGALLFIFFNGIFSVIIRKKLRLLILFFFLIIPMGWTGMHAFTPHSYAHYVLLALIGVLLPVFKNAEPRWRPAAGAAITGLGFLAGCFTFDYFFLMIFAPVAVAAIYHGQKIFDPSSVFKTVFLYSFLTAIGFALGHFLHLIQISIYYGSFAEAVKEMVSAAIYRGSNNGPNYQFLQGVRTDDCIARVYCTDIKAMGPVLGRLFLLKDYFFKFSAFDSYGRGVLFLPAMFYAGLLLLFFIPSKKMTDEQRAYQRQRFKMFLMTIGITSVALAGWILVMPNHAAVHTF